MRPRWMAIGASVVLFLLATVVPMFLGPVQYDPVLAVNSVTAIAILFTAAYAAENVIEFKAAREAEYTPVLDLSIRQVRDRQDTHLELSVRNIGRGAAAGVEATFWWLDSDQVMWLPHRVGLEHELFLPGHDGSGAVEFPWIRSLVQKQFKTSQPTVVLQLRYRDALRRDHDELLAYDFSTDEHAPNEILVPSAYSPPKELTSTEGKLKMLETQLKQLEAGANLEALGVTLHGKVTRRAIGVTAKLGEEPLWEALSGPDQAIYRVAEWVEEALPKIVRDARAKLTPASESDQGA